MKNSEERLVHVEIDNAEGYKWKLRQSSSVLYVL